MNDCIIFEDDEALGNLVSTALAPLFDRVTQILSLSDLQVFMESQDQCPSVVWMDLKVPGSTVDEVFAEARAIRIFCPNSIIVVMTGMADAHIQDRAEQSGADAVAFKPFRATPLDIARLIAIGAMNAMGRGASTGPAVLRNMCDMAVRYFESRKAAEDA